MWDLCQREDEAQCEGGPNLRDNVCALTPCSLPLSLSLSPSPDILCKMDRGLGARAGRQRLQGSRKDQGTLPSFF